MSSKMNQYELTKLLENNARDLQEILELVFVFGSKHGITGMNCTTNAKDLSTRIAKEAGECVESSPMFGIIYFNKLANGAYSITYIKPE